MSSCALEIWLITVGFAFAVFGIVMALANDTGLFHVVFDPLIERSFWPREVPADAQRFRAWGGTVAGFGLLLAAIARSAISGSNGQLWRGALGAITVWFIVGSVASIIHGAWGNALFVNVPAFVALASPLFLAGRQ